MTKYEQNRMIELANRVTDLQARVEHLESLQNAPPEDLSSRLRDVERLVAATMTGELGDE